MKKEKEPTKQLNINIPKELMDFLDEETDNKTKYIVNILGCLKQGKIVTSRYAIPTWNRGGDTYEEQCTKLFQCKHIDKVLLVTFLKTISYNTADMMLGWVNHKYESVYNEYIRWRTADIEKNDFNNNKLHIDKEIENLPIVNEHTSLDKIEEVILKGKDRIKIKSGNDNNREYKFLYRSGVKIICKWLTKNNIKYIYEDWAGEGSLYQQPYYYEHKITLEKANFPSYTTSTSSPTNGEEK